MNTYLTPDERREQADHDRAEQDAEDRQWEWEQEMDRRNAGEEPVT